MDISNTDTKLTIDTSFAEVDVSNVVIQFDSPEQAPVQTPAQQPPVETTVDLSNSTVTCESPLMMELLDYPIVLNLYVNQDMPELVEKYKESIKKHNTQVIQNAFPDSGFDLFVPQEFWSSPDKSTTMVNHQVKCEMVENNHTCAFFSFPRSSISKTPLMLANHTGIIDAGYRGFLIGAFRNLSNRSYRTDEGVRLLQICHPSLKPFVVKLITDETVLSNTTRGTGGFGSTGN